MNEYVQMIFKMKYVGGKNITLTSPPSISLQYLLHHKVTYTTQHSTAIQDSSVWYMYFFFHNISNTHHFKPQYLCISLHHTIFFIPISHNITTVPTAHQHASPLNSSHPQSTTSAFHFSLLSTSFQCYTTTPQFQQPTNTCLHSSHP